MGVGRPWVICLEDRDSRPLRTQVQSASLVPTTTACPCASCSVQVEWAVAVGIVDLVQHRLFRHWCGVGCELTSVLDVDFSWARHVCLCGVVLLGAYWPIQVLGLIGAEPTGSRHATG